MLEHETPPRCVSSRRDVSTRVADASKGSDVRRATAGHIHTARSGIEAERSRSTPDDPPPPGMVHRGPGTADTSGTMTTGTETAPLDAWLAYVPAIPYVRRIEPTDPPRAGATDFVGNAVERLLGTASTAFVTDPDLWSARIHPEDLGRVLGAWRTAAEPGAEYHLEYRMHAADGRIVHVLDDARVVESAEDGVLRWFGVVLDVTAERDSGPDMLEAEERYRLLVEQLPAVTYIDEVPAGDAGDLTPVYISPQLERLLGYTPREWLTDPDLWNHVTHPDDVAAADARASRSFQEGAPFSIEYRMITRDGRTVWVREQASLVRDAHGTPRFWQGVYIDVTELKRAETELTNALQREREAAERLRALDQMKNTFLQAVSHDLRTPLAAIYGLAVTLEQDDLDLTATDAHDMAGRIAANARKLDRLVADLLDLDRLSRGIIEPKLVDTDVAEIVRTSLAELETGEERTLVLDLQPARIPIDVSKAERIVENLVMNAVRHTAPGTTIWVRTLAVDDGALFVIEDDGAGIPRELHDAVFEPFRQGPSESSHSPGAGVGLALVARFAELHGGRAWVEERPGGGASFRVFLPGAQARTRSPFGS
jgi:PAS domain S-box-containing protein